MTSSDTRVGCASIMCECPSASLGHGTILFLHVSVKKLSTQQRRVCGSYLQFLVFYDSIMRFFNTFLSHDLQKRVVGKEEEKKKIEKDTTELTEQNTKITQEIEKMNQELKNVEK